jgi:hypothetical protein
MSKYNSSLNIYGQIQDTTLTYILGDCQLRSLILSLSEFMAKYNSSLNIYGQIQTSTQIQPSTLIQ